MSEPTAYVVLAKKDEGWHEVATVPARSRAEAIKKGAAERDGIYTAVPERSWQPIRVRTERIVVVKVEEET